MASINVSSFLDVRQFVIAAVVIVCTILCLSTTTTTAMPMKDVVGQAMMGVKMDQQQHHRQKRAVTKTDCPTPDNVDTMFQQINDQLSRTQFLNNLYDGKAISIPAGEDPVHVNQDPNENKECPATLTTDPEAPLAHRSLCPYYFNTSLLPEGYYPPTLNQAVCKCQQCVENSAYGCEPVMTRIAVLKPVGCFQGLQKYEEEIKEVATSCTCASAGTQGAQTTTTSAPTTTTTVSWEAE